MSNQQVLIQSMYVCMYVQGKDMQYGLIKYHFWIWDWYDQSNPTISKSLEPPESPELTGTTKVSEPTVLNLAVPL